MTLPSLAYYTCSLGLLSSLMCYIVNNHLIVFNKKNIVELLSKVILFCIIVYSW